MTITKNCLVTLDYRLTSPGGELLGPEEELMYLHGGYGQLFEKVEAALEGKRVGDTVRVELMPEDAFGEYDGSLLIEEALSELPEGLSVGMEIDGYLEENPDDVIVYTVKEVHPDMAVLDGNHPLAGEIVVFEAEIAEVHALDAAAVQEVLAHHEAHEHH